MICKPFTSSSKKTYLTIAAVEAAVFLIIWLLSSVSLVPTPLEILSAWNKLASQDGMLVELIASSGTLAKAIVLSSLISFGFAFLATAVIFKPVVTWLTGLRFLGFAGITFFFTMWTSNGAELKLWLLTFGMSVFMVTSALAIVNSTTREEIDYARTLRLDGWQITWEIVIRGKLDQTLDAIRQNAAMGWVMLSMVEGLVRSEGGIGLLLLTNSKFLNLGAIFAIQFTILAYGILQDMVLAWLRTIICPYIVLEGK
jgi:ABC-type nitrate/sulfonate/bicarbonate transport system permease component